MPSIKRAKVAGEPSFGVPGRPFLRFRRPTLRRRNITRLQKMDEARGVTMPEFLNLTDQHGLDTPGQGGFKGGVTIMHQRPTTPPTSPGVTRIKKAAPKGRGSIGKRVR